jgi:hypothetical protein
MTAALVPALFGLASGALVLFKQSAGVVFPAAIGLTLLMLAATRPQSRDRNAGVSLLAYLGVLVVAGGYGANGALSGTPANSGWCRREGWPQHRSVRVPRHIRLLGRDRVATVSLSHSARRRPQRLRDR